MFELIFASNNHHKIAEIQAAVGSQGRIISLAEAGIDIDIPEPYDTLEENALQKSRTIYHMTGKNCFADDTGLEVDTLGGAPGVKSARYAGEHRSFDDNIHKLLRELQDASSRRARFRVIFSLIWNHREYQFEGVTMGIITFDRRGNHGFGYDSVFLPDGSDKTFGEMTLKEKNFFNHRKKAADKLVLFLQQYLMPPENIKTH